MDQVLITGANRGLCLEFTRPLLTRGACIIATGRHPGRALELTKPATMCPGYLIDNLSEADSGRFLAYDGQELPW